MMHKTKSAKFSLAIKIASILTCVSVMAVGFASWLILKPADDQYTTGSFTVYTVEDAQISFAIADNADGTVIFGKPNPATATTKWLKPSTQVADQDLAAGFTLTISSNNSEVALQEYAEYAYVRFTPEVAADFEQALDKGVITFSAAGSATGVTIQNASYDADTDYATLAIPLSGVTATSLTVTVSFNFGWGAHFKPADAQSALNPYDFYNRSEYSTDLAADATEYLGYVAALANDKYNVVVSLNPAATAPAN